MRGAVAGGVGRRERKKKRHTPPTLPPTPSSTVNRLLCKAGAGAGEAGAGGVKRLRGRRGFAPSPGERPLPAPHRPGERGRPRCSGSDGRPSDSGGEGGSGDAGSRRSTRPPHTHFRGRAGSGQAGHAPAQALRWGAGGRVSRRRALSGAKNRCGAAGKLDRFGCSACGGERSLRGTRARQCRGAAARWRCGAFQQRRSAARPAAGPSRARRRSAIVRNPPARSAAAVAALRESREPAVRS